MNRKWMKLEAGVLSAALCLGSFVPAFAEEAEEEAPGIGVVETAYGLAQGVQGEEYTDVTLFKGVPYAAPPVGDLRWKAPEDPESWDGVRVFDTYADAAMQWTNDMEDEPWKSDFYYEEFPNFSEDCLYLNIATPAESADENLPVYVWFHGGGLNHGYSYEVECDPEALAEKGVVVVEVGHRLGVFGYMALPQLDEETEYGGSGNYGQMDCIKAVEWVKENIAAFGGDPDNITLGGQSGGTSKVATFFMNDDSKTLAKNVIMESGIKYDAMFDYNAYHPLEEVEESSIAYLQSLGLTGEESMEDLRAMDASFFMATPEEYGAAPQSTAIDGYVICYGSITEAYEAGNFDGVNILGGMNLGEKTQDRADGITAETTAEEFYEHYQELFGDLYDTYDFESIVQVTDETALPAARYITSRMDSIDYALFGAAFDELTDGTGSLYAYEFAHFAPGRDEDYYWAWHSSELWYAFGSLRDIPEQRDWTDYDHELADMMTSYWSNFMKTGDPNGDGLPEWLPSDSEHLAYLNIGENDTVECITDENMDELDQLLVAYVSEAETYPSKN